jgi:membrane associated rhomboid family serine protease
MTLAIILITALISISAFYTPRLLERFMFEPYMVKHHKQWYRYVTCGFIHADYLHLIFNMWALYIFGGIVEFYYGAIFGKNAALMYALLYVTAIFAANVSTYMKFQDAPGYRSLGASGATSAVMLVAILFEPSLHLYGLPGPIVAVLYLGGSYYASKRSNDNINHEAHLYGAIYGVLFTLFLKPEAGKLFLREVSRLFS